MVSLEGQSKQSKQSLVAPGARGELFEGGQCALREGWNGVSGALKPAQVSTSVSPVQRSCGARVCVCVCVDLFHVC